MKTYPKMKPSGVEWMGEVPEHWEMKKLKFLGKSIIGLTYNPEDVSEKEGEGSLVLRASNIQNSSLSLENNVFVNSAVPEELKIQKGDILICARNGSRELVGKNICISDESLAGSTFGAFMTVFRTPYWRFISKIFASPIFKSQSGLFQTSTINQLTTGTLNNILIPFPLEENEQTAIAAYLDRKTAQIDQSIAEKERLIELFREERQAIINHAVTKGIRPGAKMKPSGVEWIGGVPEGWEVKRLKHVAEIFGRIGFRGYTVNDIVEEGQGVITLSPGNIKNDILTLDTAAYLSFEKYYESPEIMIFPKDIVLVKTGSTIGKTAIIPENVPEMTLNPQLVVLKNLQVSPKFLYYQTTCPFFKNMFEVEQTGGTTPTISQEKINSFPIVMPPTIAEQQEIAGYIDQKTAQIDTAISGIRQEIAMLQEYRQALIFEAVTGKICVL